MVPQGSFGCRDLAKLRGARRARWASSPRDRRRLASGSPARAERNPSELSDWNASLDVVKKRWSTFAEALVLVVIAAVVIWSVLVVLPDRIDDSRFSTGGVASATARAAIEGARLKARNDATTTGVQLLAALAVLGGGYLTWRSLRLTRQGQLTDRFTAAVEHLGSDSLPVRVGAVHALGRIARDSHADQSAVMTLLAELLRARTPWPRREIADDVVEPILLPHPEVRAVAMVLAERTRREASSYRLNLSAIDFRAVSLADVAMPGYVFDGCNLKGADLSRANLERASFDGAIIREANFEGASTQNASFRGVDGVHPGT